MHKYSILLPNIIIIINVPIFKSYLVLASNINIKIFVTSAGTDAAIRHNSTRAIFVA